MTGVDTVGYNIAWFSPKPLFTNVSTGVLGHQRDRACRAASGRRCMFVGAADATRYPAGTPTGGGRQLVARRVRPRLHVAGLPDRTRPEHGHLPAGRHARRVQAHAGDRRRGSRTRTRVTANGVRPGNVRSGITDKAARYTHCVDEPAEQHDPVHRRPTPDTGPATLRHARPDPAAARSGSCSRTTTTTRPKTTRLRPRRADLALGQHPGVHG